MCPVNLAQVQSPFEGCFRSPPGFINQNFTLWKLIVIVLFDRFKRTKWLKSNRYNILKLIQRLTPFCRTKIFMWSFRVSSVYRIPHPHKNVLSNKKKLSCHYYRMHEPRKGSRGIQRKNSNYNIPHNTIFVSPTHSRNHQGRPETETSPFGLHVTDI